MWDKSYRKTCPKCHSRCVKKDGFKNWRQRYRCKECGHVFQNKRRRKKKISENLWNEYCFRRQTYQNLSDDYGISTRTVQKYLDDYEFVDPKISPWDVVLLIDTTYFQDIGIMAFKDSTTKKIIHYTIVEYENNFSYKQWVRELQEQWWNIQAIVCDGRRWLLGWFDDIPTQMCQFHQVAILRRYITKKPILEANKDLKYLGSILTCTDKETFTYELKRYYEKHESFLKERRWNESNKKWEYKHKRTRSAYFSLRRNIEYLFCSYTYIWAIDIPTTTNALEWVFGHLKGKVSLHRGLRKERKIKLILTLLHGRD